MTTSRTAAGLALALAAASACTDAVPTSGDGSLIPVEAETYEIRLSFEEVVRDFRVFKGFGVSADLSTSAVAHEWRGVEARSLVRFGDLPRAIQVFPPGQNITVPDSAYVPVSGRLVARIASFDTEGDSTVVFEAGATDAEWDLGSVGWEVAVDTLGRTVSWPEPGGGPVRSVGTTQWTPEEGDSIVFAMDSTAVTAWVEQDPASRGFRISGGTAGTRVDLDDVALQVDVRSSIAEDTIVTIQPQARTLAFLHSPDPLVDPTTIQVGGTPGRRTAIRIELPERLEGDAEICARVECPFELSPERIIFASLAMHPREAVPAGLRPRSGITLEARPALSPERLPRSPLGSAVNAGGTSLSPEYFGGGQDDTLVEVPMTLWIQDLLRSDEEDPVPSTLTLLASAEPTGMNLASFFGPGSERPPFLRLLVTVSEGVSLR